jgi:uracil-DNA glycosylase
VSDDRTGEPYSGPAGDELNEVLKAAGLRRDMIYLTNCHKCAARDKNDPYNIRAPIKAELSACQTWLDGEFQWVKPKVLVCIGSSAAKWLLGDQFDLTKQRGEWQAGPFGTRAIATYQPTYVNRLRQHNPDQAEAAWAALIADLKLAAAAAGFAP